jgi:poly[(R)-3-hydroxyalkanoate] polymerase subunit PhaC
MSQESVATQAAQFWELLQRAQTLALSAQATAFAKAAGQEFSVVDATSVGAAAMKAFAEFAQHPMELAAFQQTVWLDATKAWVDAWAGESPAVADKRFRDKTWEEDPISRGLRDGHLAVEGAVDKLLDSLPKGSKDHLSVEFYTRQFLSALSPSNFLALNPAARHRFIETEGQSVLDGFKNLLDDLEHGEGRLEISTNDKEAFVVGHDLATTPGKVVYQNDLMQLIQYEPLTETQRRRPLLFVPAWINKYYILDLRPKNSLVRYMLERGHSVFVISWVNPTKAHAEKSFEDYMRLGPLAALDAIAAATGEKRTNILGFCIGGILVTATLAWLAARKDNRIASATTLATMVDFTDC